MSEDKPAHPSTIRSLPNGERDLLLPYGLQHPKTVTLGKVFLARTHNFADEGELEEGGVLSSRTREWQAEGRQCRYHPRTLEDSL
jgi:hypothetical protein